jgi:hypothetical protein
MILDHFWNSKIFLLLAILLHFTSRFVAENSENNKNYFSNQRQAHYGRKSCHNSKKKMRFLDSTYTKAKRSALRNL